MSENQTTEQGETLWERQETRESRDFTERLYARVDWKKAAQAAQTLTPEGHRARRK